MSLTNEQITAQNFKDFYDRIRPLLNSQHYHVDRSGQELKTLYAKLDSDWTVSANQKIPFIKKSGTITQSSTGSFTIPNGTRIELLVSISHKASSGTSQPDMIYSIYNDTDGSYISTLNSIDPFQTNEYSHSNVIAIQWTNDLGHDIDISVRPTNGSNALVRALFSSLTIKEIGRIVDPVQYVANNDELEETPVGNIISYMGNSVPKHYLACNGALYNIGTYKELEAFIIDEFGSVNYFGGDGTTTWAVPDLRGEFLRGTGTNSHINQGSGANVGVHQDATEMPYIQGSHGNLGGRTKDSNTTHEVVAEYKNVDSEFGAPGNLKYASGFTNNVSDLIPDFTSRPTNTSVNYCIKYETTYHVIVPSHMYKVSITGSLDTNGDLINYTIENGEINLVNTDKNRFIAPVDGWYAISYNSGQINPNGAKFIQYIEIYRNGTRIKQVVNADGSGGITYFGVNTTANVYLQKGDSVGFRVWSQGLSVAWPSVFGTFCLLTANYKDNIIAGGEVYSEDEQVIGTWTDGKPLYQKTIHSTLPSSTGTDKFEDIGATIDTIVDIKAQALRDNNYSYAVNGVCVLGDFSSAVMVNATNNNASSNKNKVGFVVNKTQFVSRPIVVTVQYTKTTDQAGTYQYKNSLLLTRPDMWEPDTEYDFGGGLYGQRFTGTHSTAGASAKQLLASVNKIVNQGGQIKCPSWVTAPCPFGWGSNFYGMAFIDTSNKLMFNVKTQTTETATYDIWVTYKK